MALPTPSRVILFKTPADPSEDDAYHQELTAASYRPTFVPVLVERYVTPELVGILEQGGEFEGVIITSKRGAEGWIRAASRDTRPADADITATSEMTTPTATRTSSSDWSLIPLWTVGNAAIDTFRHRQTSDAALPPHLIPRLPEAIMSCSPPTDDGRCEMSVQYPSHTAKSASALIPLLLAAPPIDDTAGPVYKPYLVVRGDKSLDEIPNVLREAGRSAVEVIVYETSARDDLDGNITALCSAQGEVGWLAFFSPSSAAMVLQHLPVRVLERARVFAIGETTRRYLLERGVEVHAMADEPNAAGLSAAIRKADEDGQGT